MKFPKSVLTFALLVPALLTFVNCSGDSPTAPDPTRGPTNIPDVSPVFANFSTEVIEDNLTVIFTDLSTGNPTRYTWDFGDGQTSRQVEPVHTYREGGAYTVTLTVSDGISSDSTVQSVQFNRADLSASFTVVVTVSTRTAIFTNTSSGDPTSFSWDFGDGNRSGQENPSHIYAQTGTYVATLTVRNNTGSSSISQFVVVEEEEPDPIP